MHKEVMLCVNTWSGTSFSRMWSPAMNYASSCTQSIQHIQQISQRHAHNNGEPDNPTTKCAGALPHPVSHCQLWSCCCGAWLPIFVTWAVSFGESCSCGRKYSYFYNILIRSVTKCKAELGRKFLDTGFVIMECHFIYHIIYISHSVLIVIILPISQL